MAQKEISFEESLKKLKEIVDSLESGEVPLRESMSKFREGNDIINQCYKELENAELQVETIVKKDRSIAREPFKK